MVSRWVVVCSMGREQVVAGRVGVGNGRGGQRATQTYETFWWLGDLIQDNESSKR